jgi:hypothetical protein
MWLAVAAEPLPLVPPPPLQAARNALERQTTLSARSQLALELDVDMFDSCFNMNGKVF